MQSDWFNLFTVHVYFLSIITKMTNFGEFWLRKEIVYKFSFCKNVMKWFDNDNNCNTAKLEQNHYFQFHLHNPREFTLNLFL